MTEWLSHTLLNRHLHIDSHSRRYHKENMEDRIDRKSQLTEKRKRATQARENIYYGSLVFRLSKERECGQEVLPAWSLLILVIRDPCFPSSLGPPSPLQPCPSLFFFISSLPKGLSSSLFASSHTLLSLRRWMSNLLLNRCVPSHLLEVIFPCMNFQSPCI